VRRPIHWIIVAAMFAPLAIAQVSIGTPAFSSLGGGPFDTVNLGNFDVHFTIPVVNKAGRGTPFNYNLAYDSSIWTPTPVSGSTVWQPATNWGWQGQTEVATGYITYSTKSNRCFDPDTGWHTGTTYTWHGYRDQFGTTHRFLVLTSDNPLAGNPGCAINESNSGAATDGSGYTLNADGGSATITTIGGVVITPPLNSQSGAASFTDTNGNKISVSGTGTFTDTLGTTALTVTGAGTPSSPLKFGYAAPTSSTVYVTVNYTSYNVKTNFQCSGVSEYNQAGIPLVSSISLPDGSAYSFTYEPTPGATGYYTGRLASVQLPTGGTITYGYNYSDGHNGIVCADGTADSFTRTLSPGGQWQYFRTQVSGAHWQTTVTSPPDPINAGSASDVTVIDFQEDSNTSVPTYAFYETQRLSYQGSASGTLLNTTITCYNGVGVSSPSTCATSAVQSPLLRITVFHQIPNASGVQSETDSGFGPLGLRTSVKDYDYGVGAVGPLLRTTTTTYATMTNGIQNRPGSVVVRDGSGNAVASTTYNYDSGTPAPTTGTPQHVPISGSRGLLTSVAAQANSTTTLYRQYTYYDTGNLATSTDVSTSSSTTCSSNPQSCTTYNYSSSSCGNSFVTSISEPLSLTRSMTWNCTGGVLLSLTDENSKTSSTAYSGTNYSNVFWRPYSTTDNAGTTTDYFYYLNSSNQQFQTENKYHTAFNGGSSTVDILNTNDGFGRSVFQQTKQGPSATNFDTMATCYDAFNRVSQTTLPYAASAAISGAQSCSNPGTSFSYDALNRALNVSDSGGGLTTYAYSENDVLQTLSSPTQAKQQEYDGLGQLVSVCEVTAGTAPFPGGSCNQNVGKTGYLTKYVHDTLGNLTSVIQNAQASSGIQTRSYVYDMLGRLMSETNPETNNAAVTYSYDSLSADSACGTITSAGNKLKRLDAAGNATCYAGYDPLHRVGNITYPGTNTPASHFVYDAASLSGTSMANAKTRLAEAYTCTGTCSGKVTDLFFSYLPTGQTTDVWELTPHSGTNYYFHVTSQSWPNGAVNTLSNLSGLPTITYSTDGEGRMSTVTASSGQSPLASSVGYDAASHVTGYTLGSSDSDSFTFDPYTGRMLTYTFSMGGSPQTDSGQLHWNSNGSLQQLTITDQLNPADSQICNYTHDDVGRVASANCGASTWSQTFSYDPFGNVTKTVPLGATGTSFQPTYDYTNNTNRIISTPFTYNGNSGALTADSSHSYSWDTENRLTTVDSGGSNGICETYDALGRLVEQTRGSACSTSPTSSTEIVYSPSGEKLAVMNGSMLVKAFVPLPGGAQAVYNSSGLQFYRHPDWLGSSRLSTTPSRTCYYDVAYAPFGENYAGACITQDLSFTGQNQDTEQSSAGGAGGLYDFLYREHSPVQGRWLSPDPSGLAAANTADPQSWNRYAYVGNRPTNSIDALGLECYVDGYDIGCEDPFWMSADDGGGGGGGGGFCEQLGDCPYWLLSPWPGQFIPGNESQVPSGFKIPTLGVDSLFGFLPGLNCGGGSSGFGFAPGTPSAPPCVLAPDISVVIVETRTEGIGQKDPPAKGTPWSCAFGGVPILRPNSCFYVCRPTDGSWGVAGIRPSKDKIKAACPNSKGCPSAIDISGEPGSSYTITKCYDTPN